jgi:hypothetical protein
MTSDGQVNAIAQPPRSLVQQRAGNLDGEPHRDHFWLSTRIKDADSVREPKIRTICAGRPHMKARHPYVSTLLIVSAYIWLKSLSRNRRMRSVSNGRLSSAIVQNPQQMDFATFAKITTEAAIGRGNRAGCSFRDGGFRTLGE